jgi:GT2 family glycosyltransferase
MTSISVLIPLYQGRQVIGACIDSLLDSRDDIDLRIVVIDDASPDEAGEWVSSNYPYVEVIVNDTNRGYAFAVNRGIQNTDGDLILLLNQDTRMESGALKILEDRLNSKADIDAVVPKLLNTDGTVQPSCRMLPRHVDVLWQHLFLPRLFPRSQEFARWKMGWFNHDSEIEVEQPYFSTILLRRSVVDEIGQLDESFRIYFNDVDYCRRIKDSGGRILFTPHARVVHQLGQSTSKIPFRRIVDSHRGFIRYFFKHYRGMSYWIPNIGVAAILAASAVVRLTLTALCLPFTSRGPSS